MFFLLYINDLFKFGIFGYVDDSIVVERYVFDVWISGIQIQFLREFMVEWLNLFLKVVFDWGDVNLVKFNVIKIQVCLFFVKWS